MRLMSRVCAEFHDRSGAVLFAIKPADRMAYIDVPDSIRQDPLYDMLVNDGSILMADGSAPQKLAENDPEEAFRIAAKNAKTAKAGKAEKNVPADVPAEAAAQPDGGNDGKK